jgi:hypothetical protein
MTGLSTITMPRKKSRRTFFAAACSCLSRLLISLIIISACLPQRAIGQSSSSSRWDIKHLDQEGIEVSGIRVTAPLDGWVLSRPSHTQFFIIQYYSVVEQLKPDLLTPSLTCLTKAFVDNVEIFSLELSAEIGYAASAYVEAPRGTHV